MKLDGLVLGDELLVDGTPYGVGEQWALLTHVSSGSASVYPYKVLLSNGAPGQYKAAEIRGWRRPLRLHETIREVEGLHPGFAESLAGDARTPR